ncbi:hypothetical protein PQR46_07195 [Paraburkholderia sediminicola]|uniref:hypothetical protein n=1 Tax=Paraburkholderia TaxID=1822464 RepID=UPI0038BA4752
MSNPLSQSLRLPSGAILANRLVKAAMSEGMADANNHSTPRLEALYRRWRVLAPGCFSPAISRWTGGISSARAIS